MSRRLAFAWFAVSLVVYNLNLRPIASGDTLPAALLPFSLTLDHRLHLDRFHGWYCENVHGGDAAPHMFRATANHVFSAYPVGLPRLLTPFYAPLIVLLRVGEWPLDIQYAMAMSLEKVTASLIAAAAVVAFFALARRLASARVACALTFLFALVTPNWSISSQARWTHGAGVLTILLSLYWLHRSSDSSRPLWTLFLAGLFAGLSRAIRPTNACFVVAGGLAVLCFQPRWKALCAYAVRPLVFGLLVA